MPIDAAIHRDNIRLFLLFCRRHFQSKFTPAHSRKFQSKFTPAHSRKFQSEFTPAHSRKFRLQAKGTTRSEPSELYYV